MNWTSVTLNEQALLPGHKSDQDQAREHEGIGLRLRDRGMPRTRTCPPLLMSLAFVKITPLGKATSELRSIQAAPSFLSFSINSIRKLNERPKRSSFHTTSTSLFPTVAIAWDSLSRSTSDPVDALVGKYPFAPCLVQSIHLQVKILVIRGYTRIADFHGFSLSVFAWPRCNNGSTKPVPCIVRPSVAKGTPRAADGPALAVAEQR